MNAQRLPADFDWPDLSYPVTPDTGRAPIVLPSALDPWDAAEMRHWSRFTRETVTARARLALEDPEHERDTVAPLSGVRARWLLLTLAEEDAARRPPPVGRRDKLESGRDLLDRLGADPGRVRGMIACPAHEDRHPSLSWSLAVDGRALLHCFAGCTFAEIVRAAP